MRLVQRVRALRRLSTEADRAPAGAADREMARGTRGTRGSGKSLIGSNNQYGATPGEYTSSTELEGSDMLVEVLAEEYRHKRTLEFQDAALTLSDLVDVADEDDADAKAGAHGVKGPFMQHRKYLTHRGVGDGTVFARENMAVQNRMEAAQERAYDYKLPVAAKAQREALAQQRKHGGNLVEEAIVRAIADGQFDNLEGRGKALPDESNPFEDAGTRTFNRILRKAGCAPRWVEENRDIRADLRLSRLYLAARWSVLAAAKGVSVEPGVGAESAKAMAAIARARLRRAELAWEGELAAFEGKVDSLNRRVRTYNLMAPTAAAVMQRISFRSEVLDVQEGRTVYDAAALRELDDGAAFSLSAAAALPSASAPLSDVSAASWTGGIALAPVAADAFSLSKVTWPRWSDVLDALRWR